MPSRLDRFGYGVTIPATTARVVDAAVEILGDPDPDEMAFLHSVLAQTFLPYRDPKTRDYVRENGRASMVLTAGYLLDPATRKPVLQGLPYGTKPRLLLVHLGSTPGFPPTPASASCGRPKFTCRRRSSKACRTTHSRWTRALVHTVPARRTGASVGERGDQQQDDGGPVRGQRGAGHTRH